MEKVRDGHCVGAGESMAKDWCCGVWWRWWLRLVWDE